MENKYIENPAYNKDMGTKHEDRSDIEKFEAGVRSNEKILKEALVHGVETNNDSLVQNSIDMIEEIGVAEHLVKPNKNKEDSKNKQGRGAEKLDGSYDLIKETSLKLAEGNPKEEVRLEKRLFHLQNKWNDAERAIAQVEHEKKEEKRGRPIISFIENQGRIERIIKDPKDIIEAIPNR